jgi:putative lipoprotein
MPFPIPRSHALPHALLVGLALLLAACGTARPAAAPAPGEALPPPPAAGLQMLYGVDWQVVEFGGRPVAEGTKISLSFAPGGAFGGNGGCNALTGTYAMADGAFTIRPAAAAGAACAEPAAAQEQLFLRFVAAVRSFTFDPSGNLLLSTSDGQTIRAVRG